MSLCCKDREPVRQQTRHSNLLTIVINGADTFWSPCLTCFVIDCLMKLLLDRLKPTVIWSDSSHWYRFIKRTLVIGLNPPRNTTYWAKSFSSRLHICTTHTVYQRLCIFSTILVFRTKSKKNNFHRSQRSKTKLLHNTVSYLYLDLQHVSVRFIGHLQGVTRSDISNLMLFRVVNSKLQNPSVLLPGNVQ